MDDFSSILQLLERELDNQNRLLQLLTEEQVAIVTVNQERIEAINAKKESLLEDARALEQSRTEILSRIYQGDKKALKLAKVIENCDSAPTRSRLEQVGKDLKLTVHSVRELNQLNGDLIRQSLGIISSTLSIICSSPSADLPTYSKSGSIRTSEEGGRKRTTA